MRAIPQGRTARRTAKMTLVLPLLASVACTQNGGFDFDLRDNLGNAFDTSSAVMNVRTEVRPQPDNRGIISYPTYQVAVARNGDTLRTVAGRVGLSVDELSNFNAMPPDLPLRRGQVIALPRRVAEPSPATGAAASGPIRPTQTPAATALPESEDIAVAPLDDPATPTARPVRRTEKPSLAQSGTEPVRHKVKRGETAYSIARTYGIPVKALADWNGLTGDLALREGQYLLIPVAVDSPKAQNTTTAPGSGSVAPVPPSAATPLPDEDATTARPKETPPSPAMADDKTKATKATRLALPVSGPIIRAYRKGKNDGIDISASAGTAVVAAEAGVVAAITRDTDQIPILVLRHPGNILTVYAGVDRITVNKGDTVKRGQQIAAVRAANPAVLHFEVREGFESVDPEPYVN
ncbi:M23 family metallopeptidase [Oceaniglobus indicus]|uniref:M23 family metallopeptidase n=1 Tax=Oceaniglobus indicus TaxID=2047749 RepID=UPI000C17DFCB|nr:M23 family metallopeptidase [Oceaniglobus indicus]